MIFNIYDLHTSILGSGYTEIVDIQQFIDPVTWKLVKSLIEKAFPLNPSQRAPFDMIFTHGVASGLMLIQGPLGTGKMLFLDCSW